MKGVLLLLITLCMLHCSQCTPIDDEGQQPGQELSQLEDVEDIVEGDEDTLNNDASQLADDTEVQQESEEAGNSVLDDVVDVLDNNKDDTVEIKEEEDGNLIIRSKSKNCGGCYGQAGDKQHACLREMVVKVPYEHKVYTKCGWLWRSRCYKRTETRYKYRHNGHKYECCTGFNLDGKYCYKQSSG